jgi:hypothetical protein
MLEKMLGEILRARDNSSHESQRRFPDNQVEDIVRHKGP